MIDLLDPDAKDTVSLDDCDIPIMYLNNNGSDTFSYSIEDVLAWIKFNVDNLD